MRLDALKIYLFQLFAEGEFSGARSWQDRLLRATTLFAEDVPAALADMIDGAITADDKLEAVKQKIASAAFSKLSDVFGAVRKRGVGAVWRDLKEQYNRGMEANAAARKKK